MKSPRLITAVTLLTASSNLFAATAFFSTKGFGEGATLGNPTLTLTPSDPSVDLHIYFIPGPADATYLGLSFGVTSTTSGVADITAFSVLNPDVLVGAIDVDDRWNGTGGTLLSAQEISNMSGISVDKAGLDPANDGSGPFLDAGYDTSAGAFYFGVVTVDPVGLGSTDLSLTVGTSGIARVGDAPQPTGPTVSLTFGAAEPTAVLGDDFGETGTVPDASITVVPEPSPALLLCAGLVLGFLRRRRPGS